MSGLLNTAFACTNYSSSAGKTLMLATGKSACNTRLSLYVPMPTELISALAEPEIGAKDGRYFIRCFGRRRTNKDTTQNADILIIDADSRINVSTGKIVKGAVPYDEISSILCELNINFCLYTTYSHDIDYNKYRVIIFCRYSREQLPRLLDYLFAEFHRRGVMLAPVKENKTWAQPWYFPRVPDKWHKALFYHFSYMLGENLDADKIAPLDSQGISERIKDEPQTVVPDVAAELDTRQRNAIREFNQAYSIEMILLRNGYTLVKGAFLRSDSESGNPGVKYFESSNENEERVFSFGNDVLNDGKPHDAFDCYRLLECNGDWATALAWDSALTKHNQTNYAQERAKAINPFNAQNTNLPVHNAELSSHNNILDDENHYCRLDFIQAVDAEHVLVKYAVSLAEVTFIPVHTIFLVGLAIFASVACRTYKVAYPRSGDLPLGLYVIAEHPSGTAKSRIVKTFQHPFYNLEREIKQQAKTHVVQLKKREQNRKKEGDTLDEQDTAELTRCENILKSALFTTNSTPEALEQILSFSNGFFSAISSEQGLFNAMLGACYGADKVSNNDLLLNGYDAGYMNSKRVGRSGYTGTVVGGAVMFAQAGGIENLLKASNGTGLAERFLLVAEKHSLGQRDFCHKADLNLIAVGQFNQLVFELFRGCLENPLDYQDLSKLEICAIGWQRINNFRHEIEPNLADGGRYSHIAIRGAAAKIDMQIMKIAANLHLSDPQQRGSQTIAIKYVDSAIVIANSLLEANLNLCTDKGILGQKAEYSAILSLFRHVNEGLPERKIIQSKINTLPFKEFTGNKSERIRAALNEMVELKLLQLTYQPAKTQQGKPIKLYALAQ